MRKVSSAILPPNTLGSQMLRLASDPKHPLRLSKITQHVSTGFTVGADSLKEHVEFVKTLVDTLESYDDTIALTDQGNWRFGAYNVG